jgi:pyruvate kinase
MTERKAKIVATLGPSCQDEDAIRSLILAGIDVARLNFSHGTHDFHASVIALLRRLSEELHKPVTILQDLQGPKLRVGDLPTDGVELAAGEAVILSCVEDEDKARKSSPNAKLIPLDVPDLINSVSVGKRILLDDGHLEMEITGIFEDFIQAKVVLGGILTSHKGVNLPGAHISIPGFTEKDKVDLKFGIDQGVDAVAISFVRTPDDVTVVRQAIKEQAPERANIPIIAKIERPEALKNLTGILKVADGVMVARGDLGVEISPAAVPIMQKKIIQDANRTLKVVITATQMLDSMILNPRPTRAEASDVANAIFDGTDAVMLSGETASGKYPTESVAMMDNIVREAEAHFSEWGKCEYEAEEPTQEDAISMTHAARELAHDRNVAAIAVFTQTGTTALLMSKAKPMVPIHAFTPDQRTYQRLGLYWNIFPHLVPFVDTVEAMLTHVETAIKASMPLKPGHQFILISGFPVGTSRPPNFAMLHTIGEKV